MTAYQKISAKNLTFEDLCAHTSELFPHPDKEIYTEMHAHLAPLFAQMRAASPYAKTELMLNTIGDALYYNKQGDHSGHERMSSPWLREEEKNIAVLESLAKEAYHFIVDEFLQNFFFDSIWREKNADHINIFFNELRLYIKDEATVSLTAFLLCAIHASFFNGRTRDDMTKFKALTHSFTLGNDHSTMTIESMGINPKDAERVYYEGIDIAKSMQSKFLEFSFIG